MNKSTLLVLLEQLEKFGLTISMLISKYQLNRQSLWRIRKGLDLPLAHSYYFRCFMEEMQLLRIDALKRADIRKYRELTDLMFQMMATELNLVFLMEK